MADVVACKDKPGVQTFQDLVEKLDEWMTKVHTNQDIWVIVKQAILEWTED